MYRGRKPSLTAEQAEDLRGRVASGGKKAVLARSSASAGRRCTSTCMRIEAKRWKTTDRGSAQCVAIYMSLRMGKEQAADGCQQP